MSTYQQSGKILSGCFFLKHTNVVITLLAYYDASGVMTEFPDGYTEDYKKLYDESEDIAKQDFESISDLIRFDSPFMVKAHENKKCTLFTDKVQDKKVQESKQARECCDFHVTRIK